MQTIIPFLWFDDSAEEAVEFYRTVFKTSAVKRITRHGDGGPGPAGKVLTIAFNLDGQDFIALNGGPRFKFTEAVSFVVNCQSQADVDHYWEKLSAGGSTGQCGWLKDKFGLSWQVFPSSVVGWFGGPEPERSKRAMDAMLRMTKIDIAALKRAYDGD